MAIPIVPLLGGLAGSLLGGLFGRSRPNNSAAELEAQRQRDLEAKETARRNQERQQFLSQQQQEQAKRQQEEQQFNQMLGTVRGSNYDLAKSVIDSYGLNSQEFSPRIQSELDRMLVGTKPGADITNIVNGRSIASSILDDELRKQRTQLGQQAEQKFGGNFSDRFVQGNMLDGIVDQIVSEQKQNALDFVDRGAKRGIFNEIGQSAAMNKIGQSAEVGRSTVSNLAGGIIDNYRTQLGGVRDQAFNSAQGFNFGSNINFDELLGRASEIGQRAQTNAPGELRGAVGGQNFFDLSNIKMAGGQAQGAINNRDTEIGAALEQRRRNSAMSRGIGSQGAF
jgi:hypothetical protein